MSSNFNRELCKQMRAGYLRGMSFAEVLEELPGLTFEQRQLLIRRAMELDGSPLSREDEALVEERLAAHHADPSSSLPVDKVKARLSARFPK
jgi:uncharacterized protein Smg (DUF494 family)